MKFSGEFSPEEVAEHIAEYVSRFFSKYRVKSVKGINLYFNLYADEGKMVAPGRDGEIIEIIEITDPHKMGKTKGNVVQIPFADVIEITGQDLEREQLAKMERRFERQMEEYKKMREGKKSKSTKKKNQGKMVKEDFKERPRLLKRKSKNSEE